MAEQATVVDFASDQLAARDALRARVAREELVERLARAVPHEGTATPLPGLQLRRASAPTELGYGVSFPAWCVIAQGSKELRLGSVCYRYDPAHYLVATAELPIASRITEASPERPYLGLVLKLDPTLVGSVMIEAGQFVPRHHVPVRAIAVSRLDAELLDAAVRLVRLLDRPADAAFLAPLVTREIVYRLLTGEQGDRVCHVAAHAGQTQRIARAIERLRTEFDRPLRVEQLARELGMSVSGFHQHFKAVTGLSPLQFQKQLRLQEARRLMLSEGLDAASAGYRVGYHDASHFSREYKRLFGVPPLQDVRRLREPARESAGL